MEKTTTIIPQGDVERQLWYCEQVAAVTAQWPERPLAFVDTYGCQQNEADSERIRGYLQEMGYGFTDDEICQALFNAAAIGYLITRNATTAGAEGGCQAEVGSASAMAASAAVELFGGTPRQCMDAASFAMVNILGLVCDPIGGLVENPCQNRNAMGASNALISAELSLAGVKSITPIDETIGVMYAVGRSIPSELRETSLGGMAVAKSACENCMACANKRNKMKK